ncbi:MAG: hypothetical protein AB9922_04685 [Bacteroidales bacterium]
MKKKILIVSLFLMLLATIAFSEVIFRVLNDDYAWAYGRCDSGSQGCCIECPCCHNYMFSLTHYGVAVITSGACGHCGYEFKPQ